MQDFGLARKWLDAAARAGDDIAMRNLGDMDTQGLGAEADPVSAYAYYDAAASLGNRYGELQRDRIAGTLTADQQREGEKKADALIAALSPKPKPAAPSDKATAPKAAS